MGGRAERLRACREERRAFSGLLERALPVLRDSEEQGARVRWPELL